MAIRIEIDTQDGCSWMFDKYDTWKDYVGVENFDETFVLKGNRNYHSHEEASWYNKVTELLTDIDSYYDLETEEGVQDLLDEHSISKQQYTEIISLYDKCRRINDIVVEVLNIIYPDKEFKERTIRGYSQSDWQKVIYDSSLASDKDVEMLEAIYFGQLNEISYKDENDTWTSSYITDDELWKREREKTIEEYIRSEFDIDKNEELEIFVSDGYIQQTKWKKVN